MFLQRGKSAGGIPAVDLSKQSFAEVQAQEKQGLGEEQPEAKSPVAAPMDAISMDGERFAARDLIGTAVHPDDPHLLPVHLGKKASKRAFAAMAAEARGSPPGFKAPTSPKSPAKGKHGGKGSPKSPVKNGKGRDVGPGANVGTSIGDGAAARAAVTGPTPSASDADAASAPQPPPGDVPVGAEAGPGAAPDGDPAAAREAGKEDQASAGGATAGNSDGRRRSGATAEALPADASDRGDAADPDNASGSSGADDFGADSGTTAAAPAVACGVAELDEPPLGSTSASSDASGAPAAAAAAAADGSSSRRKDDGAAGEAPAAESPAANGARRDEKTAVCGAVRSAVLTADSAASIERCGGDAVAGGTSDSAPGGRTTGARDEFPRGYFGGCSGPGYETDVVPPREGLEWSEILYVALPRPVRPKDVYNATFKFEEKNEAGIGKLGRRQLMDLFLPGAEPICVQFSRKVQKSPVSVFVNDDVTQMQIEFVCTDSLNSLD